MESQNKSQLQLTELSYSDAKKINDLFLSSTFSTRHVFEVLQGKRNNPVIIQAAKAYLTIKVTNQTNLESAAKTFKAAALLHDSHNRKNSKGGRPYKAINNPSNANIPC
jgi:hypothetical protein